MVWLSPVLQLGATEQSTLCWTAVVSESIVMNDQGALLRCIRCTSMRETSSKRVWKRCGPHPLENSPRTKVLFPLTAQQERACRAIYEVVA